MTSTCSSRVRDCSACMVSISLSSSCDNDGSCCTAETLADGEERVLLAFNCDNGVVGTDGTADGVAAEDRADGPRMLPPRNASPPVDPVEGV
jgi:hypothetical protein